MEKITKYLNKKYNELQDVFITTDGFYFVIDRYGPDIAEYNGKKWIGWSHSKKEFKKKYDTLEQK